MLPQPHTLDLFLASFFLLLIFPSSLGWFHFWNILLKTALKQHTPSRPLLFHRFSSFILHEKYYSQGALLFSSPLTQSTINYNASNFIILTFSSFFFFESCTIYHQIERLSQLQQLRSSRRCRGSNILQHFCHRRRSRRRPTAAISHAPHNLLVHDPGRLKISSAAAAPATPIQSNSQERKKKRRKKKLQVLHTFLFFSAQIKSVTHFCDAIFTPKSRTHARNG